MTEEAAKKSSEAQNIHQKMLAVMRSVDYVMKEKKKVNNQYRFVSHDAVVAAVRPHLVDNGIVTQCSVLSHEQDGNRTVADVMVSFINADDPEDCVDCHGFGYGIDSQDKGPGKAISYAVKYIFLKTFCLETGDDPERDTKANYESPEDIEAEVRAALYKEIKAARERFNISKESLSEILGGKSAPDMSVEQLREVPRLMEEKLSAIEEAPEEEPPEEPPEEEETPKPLPPEPVDLEKVLVKDVSNADIMNNIKYYAAKLDITREEVENIAEIEYDKKMSKLSKTEARNFALLLKKLEHDKMT